MFAVAECFLLSGSISVLKHTMSITRAKLVSDGPESLIVTCSQQSSSEQRSDAALPTGSGSNTSGDDLSDESEKAGDDMKVKKETTLEEMVGPGGEHGDSSSALNVDSKTQPASVTDFVPDQQLSGSDEANANVLDVSASGSSSVVKDEPAVMSCDAVVTQGESKQKEIEQVHRSEDRSLDQRVDEDETLDTSQSDAARGRDAATESSRDEDAAAVAGCSEFDLISINDQTLHPADTLAGQTTTAEPSADIDTTTDTLAVQTTTTETLAVQTATAEPYTDTDTSADTVIRQTSTAEAYTDINLSVVDVDGEKNDVTTSTESAVITVLVGGIPVGLDETVEMYLESKKKGGGKILSFKYNKRNGSALVVFADNTGL